MPGHAEFTTPTATDTCDATVTLTFTSDDSRGTCAGGYSVTRTWTATDDCGNTQHGQPDDHGAGHDQRR